MPEGGTQRQLRSWPRPPLSFGGPPLPFRNSTKSADDKPHGKDQARVTTVLQRIRKMPSSLFEMKAKQHPHDPATRGYSVAYRAGQINFCPGCGRTHWYVGRVSAECGFCATALPLVEATTRGASSHARWSGQNTPLAA
jgi:hypothetical protein